MNFKNVEDLYWRRINNLIEIISRISDDIVYRNIWVDKLLELLQERKKYE
jgi:hypothetical protein